MKSANYSYKVSDKLNSREQEFYFAILKLLDEQSFITARIISDTTAMPESTTRRYLTKLCRLELIRADGRNRGKKYYKA